ncbi:major capsid protein [Capybara microvirus Cap3_SP_668]|nr:major capsid protein [Capybara microvirus Cap3_SP_668]
MSIFNSIALPKIGSSAFNLTRDNLLSFDYGKLVPIFCEETLPGDKWKIKPEVMLYLMPMLAPVLTEQNAYLHWFFVPNRLIWKEWEDFVTGGKDGTSAPVHPFKTLASYDGTEQSPKSNAVNTGIGSLADYLEFPSYNNANADVRKVSALPFRAYNLIYNEYFRDQNLEDEIVVSTESGSDFVTPSSLRLRSWTKDYFTSSLPFTQRGPEAMIPIGGQPILMSNSTQSDLNDREIIFSNQGSRTEIYGQGDGQGAMKHLDTSQSTRLKTSDNASASINDLRRAARLQEWLERSARGGARYIEQILAHFGVKSSDSRLQRPEYLGGSQQPISISSIMQMSQTDVTPQGNRSGAGISVGSGKVIKHYCEEHGFIIGILSVIPKPQYFQGIPRKYKKFDKFDYAWPSFAHLGEQPIMDSELYIGAQTASDGVFGYIPRYSEYKTAQSKVHGQFRSSLEYWTMSRKFANQPTLSSEFMHVDSETTSKPFAIQGQTDHLLGIVKVGVNCVRKLPRYGVPQL